jgi:glycosyltransferase involved in cell wall biosynthesis
VSLAYALVTPARDEAPNLRRLADCLLAQTIRPSEWIVVDDGSADETRAVVGELAGRYEWIRLLESPGAIDHEGPLGQGRRVGRDVVAFTAGLDALRQRPDIVLKLDADVSFDARFFERLLDAFKRDTTLGIAGGLCYEEEDGVWAPRHATEGHVRGATRAYRWSCLEQILPIERRLGWDGIDELKANVRGWRTETLAELPFFHHRKVGERDGARRAWWAQGTAAHYMGYRLSYLVFRSLHHARRNRAALAMIGGFVAAAVRRQPRYDDAVVRAYLRRRQSIRNLAARRREALGR